MGELLFLLSSSDRMKLLSEIRGGDLRLTVLAERLSATVQETSKHLGRLADGDLIEKSSTGSYRLTCFGRIVFDLLPSLGFISQYRKYFLTHDISSVPQEFILRIGELSEHSYVDHVTNVLTECQHLLGMAEQYFYWIVDQPLPWSITKSFSESMAVKAILQTDISPDGYRLARGILGPKAEVRFADQVKVAFAVNEKMAGISFPGVDGRPDFSCGFLGYGSGFQRWCFDLFNYFWDNSRKAWPSSLEALSSDRRAVSDSRR